MKTAGVKFGWTGGGGFDICVSSHVLLNFTYLYVDLEDSHTGQDFFFEGGGPPREFEVLRALRATTLPCVPGWSELQNSKKVKKFLQTAALVFPMPPFCFSGKIRSQ